MTLTIKKMNHPQIQVLACGGLMNGFNPKGGFPRSRRDAHLILYGTNRKVNPIKSNGLGKIRRFSLSNLAPNKVAGFP
jgi:hypothetical protein